MNENQRTSILDHTSTFKVQPIAQIVLPIRPLKMSADMRNTFRMSQSIRQQQNSLIAASNSFDSSGARSADSESSSLRSASEERESRFGNVADTEGDAEASHVNADADSNTNANENSNDADADANNADADADADTGSVTDAVSAQASDKASRLAPDSANSMSTAVNSGTSAPNSASSAAELTGTHDANANEDLPRISMLSSDSEKSFEFDRISASLGRKRLRREKAPRPLNIPGQIRGISPIINSAPIRPYYSSPYGVPPGYQPRNTAAGYYQVRRVPVRGFMPSVPYTAVQMVSTPSRRAMNVNDRRVTPRPRTKERRKPVQDVFLGDLTKDAPMRSQPPSAQREHFANGDEDRTEATEDEMREMESKRRAHSIVQGSICLNGEPAFKFKIFEAGDDAKAKFLKVCETTWDEYVARSGWRSTGL